MLRDMEGKEGERSGNLFDGRVDRRQHPLQTDRKIDLVLPFPKESEIT